MNINFDDLEKIIALAERSDIESLEIVDGQQRIHVVVNPPAAPSTATSNSATANQPLAAPASDTTANNSPNHTADDNTNQKPATSDKSADSSATDSDAIVAPMMGTFYLRSEPSADVFVTEGDSVSAGDTLCVIEAMKIMHEVKAESDCVIDRILIGEGDVVDFGQKLFETHIA